MQNLILYDWLSFSSKCHTVEDIKDLLGLSSAPWQTLKGFYGYRDRDYYGSISIHYNGRPGMGVLCEMSGQGCRTFETYGYNDFEQLFLILFMHMPNVNITRLDVAFDDHTGILDINQLVNDCLNTDYVSKSNCFQVNISNKGKSLQHGSMKSDVFIRIYDKAKERNCPEGEHWVRCEMQLRNDRAVKFLELPYSIGESYCSVLLNYLRYVDPDPEDSNRWRWPLKSYWGDLVGNASAISIYSKPGTDYNIDHLDDFCFRQAGNAINAELAIRGFEGFLDKLKNRKVTPNPKYDTLINQYRGKL